MVMPFDNKYWSHNLRMTLFMDSGSDELAQASYTLAKGLQ